MPPSLPTDRALALSCSLRTLRHLALHVRCCNSRTIPLRIIDRPGTLADYVMVLRCGRCGLPPKLAFLVHRKEEAAPPLHGGKGWRLVVVGVDAPEPMFGIKLAMVKA